MKKKIYTALFLLMSVCFLLLSACVSSGGEHLTDGSSGPSDAGSDRIEESVPTEQSGFSEQKEASPAEPDESGTGGETVNASEKFASRYGEITYPGIAWMALPDEVCTALGVNLSDFKMSDDLSSEHFRDVKYTTTGVLYGKRAELCFQFTSAYDKKELYLAGVVVTIEDPSHKLYTAVCDSLEESFKSQSIGVETTTRNTRWLEDGESEVFTGGEDPYKAEGTVEFSRSCRYDTKKTTRELPEDVLKKADAGIKKMNPGASVDQMEGPLSCVSILYHEKKGSAEKNMTLRFSADTLIQILIFTV